MIPLLVLLTAPGARAPAGRISDAGFRVREVACPSPDDVGAAAARYLAEGAETVVVAGGDDYVHAAVQELAQTTARLGVIPDGRSRIAEVLGLPRDPDAAADVVVGSRVRDLDLGRAGATWFISSLTTGFDGRRTDLRGLRPTRYLFSAPAGDHRLDAVAAGVRVTAGQLEAIAYRRRRDVAARRGEVVVRGREVAIAAPAVTAWADGVPIAPLPVHVTVERAALRIIAP